MGMPFGKSLLWLLRPLGLGLGRDAPFSTLLNSWKRKKKGDGEKDVKGEGEGGDERDRLR
jgi:hypothetical protein